MVMIGFTVKDASINIRSEKKTTTIRPKLSDERKLSMIKNGLHLYEYPRTKYMRLIAKAKVKHIEDFVPNAVTHHVLESIALNDGFKSIKEFCDFFQDKYGPDWSNSEYSIITWTDLEIPPLKGE